MEATTSMSQNPNTNCLEGVRCPKCGNHEEFRIEVQVVMKVTDEGTEDIGGEYNWHDDSFCHCVQCEHEGTVLDFYERIT